MKRNLFLIVVLIFVTTLSLSAKVKLPSVLGDNMVLQQQTNVKLWGESLPSQKVTISTSWNHKRYNVKSNEEGKWLATIQTPVAGGPYSITISDGEQLVLKNILIGEVWFCSGQSNMEMPIKGFDKQPVDGSNDVIAKAKPEIPIRMFTVKRNSSKTLLSDCQGSWEENNSMAVANASATAYFFGRYLQEVLNVPVGLVISDWGGSKIEAWIGRDVLGSFKEVNLSHLDDSAQVESPNQKGCMLYNAMVYPLLNFTIKGAIWYQGESNLSNPELYERLMPAFVSELRNDWKLGDFPFYYVQIAPFSYESPDGLVSAKLREAQLKCMSLIPNSGMAVTLDAGLKNGIHPCQKEKVGNRLAYWALAKTYGREGFSYAGPVYKSMEIKENKVYLSFDAKGGISPLEEEIPNFEVAGNDKTFYPAHAIVENSGKLKVFSDQVSSPVAVRYGFKNYIVGGLFDGYGLPASSFRTDNW